MIYYLETMEEVDLLRTILDIDSRMYEHFVNVEDVQDRLDNLANKKERERLLQVIRDAGLSTDEVLQILSTNPQNETPAQIVSEAARGVKVVNVSENQRLIIDANLKRERETKKSKMQALLDKYNIGG